MKVSETATRLRVSEATVEALEEALAAKARALAEAATREAKLRTDLDAARLGLVTSSAGDVPGDDVPAAPAAADPSAHPALREWRDRARAAESARDDAERRAARLASENAALVSMLERYRGVDPNTVDDPDPTNPRERSRRDARRRRRGRTRELSRAPSRGGDRPGRLARARREPLRPTRRRRSVRRRRDPARRIALADVEALARRVDEAERLAAAAVAAAAKESPSSIARRRRAEANDARLEQSRRYLERADAAANVVPAPPKIALVAKTASVTKSASARATCDANVALAEALAAARRVSETAERRLAAGAEALRARGGGFETPASRPGYAETRRGRRRGRSSRGGIHRARRRRG